ncbi:MULTISPECIES: DUF5320 domain-containing protein [Tissierellales]|jgi:hypothetical protein|uniref:Uncharacterized protein n=1 Tax=Acidilutibacter cellobiosedens TaxID=2507161 RepID=A0A410QEL7_9FIRM|nr:MULTISPECIES: DUF5320 domain-containing protein [Tissierellales]MBE6082684.1 hypothetical protein [Tissierellaceae bacterium]QAT62278.1 hypothetical protein EQM13_12120 [Acidilutibacter cellobiosedens]
MDSTLLTSKEKNYEDKTIETLEEKVRILEDQLKSIDKDLKERVSYIEYFLDRKTRGFFSRIKGR